MMNKHMVSGKESIKEHQAQADQGWEMLPLNQP